MPREWLSRMGPPVQDSGVGLAGMRERLNELRGGLEIEAADPGMRLRAVVPLLADLQPLTLDGSAALQFPLAGATELTLSHALRM